MSALIWREDQFLIGIRKMDDQHRQLVGLINALHAQKDMLNKDFFDKVFATLLHYTKKHFVDEEKILKKMSYPGLVEHHAQHLNFIKTVTDLKGQFEQNGATPESISRLTKFLADWLTHHILVEDKAYVDYLES